MAERTRRVAVLPGDDAAPEAVYASLGVLRQLELPIEWLLLPNGEELAATRSREDAEKLVRETADRCDSLLFGATSGKTPGDYASGRAVLSDFSTHASAQKVSNLLAALSVVFLVLGFFRRLGCGSGHLFAHHPLREGLRAAHHVRGRLDRHGHQGIGQLGHDPRKGLHELAPFVDVERVGVDRAGRLAQRVVEQNADRGQMSELGFDEQIVGDALDVRFADTVAQGLRSSFSALVATRRISLHGSSPTLDARLCVKTPRLRQNRPSATSLRPP